MAYINNAYSADDSETQKLKELLVTHSLQVARKALEIAHTHALPLADGDIVAAAMLHDIGIIATNAPGIHCHGTEHYLRHGVLGAAMLREAGAPEWLARVAERHTGTGITAKDIADYMPETLLERLVCYADKFYSKSHPQVEKTPAQARASVARFGADNAARFDDLAAIFG
ncbi:MAG TPA: HD domain-containing protein [Muribaculaceae bacterium]|nr:HD domain-containing protein [Muribaculaceae bacterium]